VTEPKANEGCVTGEVGAVVAVVCFTGDAAGVADWFLLARMFLIRASPSSAARLQPSSMVAVKINISSFSRISGVTMELRIVLHTATNEVSARSSWFKLSCARPCRS